MKAVLSARACLCWRAPRAVFYGLIALVLIGASIATAQSGGALVQRLDSIAGAGVLEDRAVSIVAAVVKGKDTLLLKAYGKADVEGDVPATVDTVFRSAPSPSTSPPPQFHGRRQEKHFWPLSIA